MVVVAPVVGIREDEDVVGVEWVVQGREVRIYRKGGGKCEEGWGH